MTKSGIHILHDGRETVLETVEELCVQEGWKLVIMKQFHQFKTMGHA
jgi:hypothetical protein